MNPNELLAQQQQMLNQMAQNAQQQANQWLFIYIATFLVLAFIHGWVIYMFYARVRDIANELRKMRVTYEMEQERSVRVASRAAAATQPSSATASNASGEEKYQPKKS